MQRPGDQVTGDHGQAAPGRDPGEGRSGKQRRERAAQRDSEQYDREHEGEGGIAARRIEDQQAKPDDLQPQRQSTGGCGCGKQPGWRAKDRRYARCSGAGKLRILQGEDRRQQIEARGDQRRSAQTQFADQVVLGKKRGHAGAEGIGRVQDAQCPGRVLVREDSYSEREGHAHGGRRHQHRRKRQQQAQPCKRRGMFHQRREPLADQGLQSGQGPDEQGSRDRDCDLGRCKGARGTPDLPRPARGQHAAERHPEHESREHERPRPHGIADHAAKRAKPKHFEQQRRRAGGEKRERQPERLSD